MAGIDKHLWAPHTAQRKQETMYHLRRLIRDRGVGVEYGLRSVTCALGEDLDSLMDEALQSKCPEDGQNLLMYAAAQGNEAWFLRLVGDIRSRLGVCALVQELREVDIDGSPLLFHAASGRREHSCFQTAYDLIYTVLGKGGLMEQVEAMDGLGRRLLMHAARSNHVQTFKDVFELCEKNAALMAPLSKLDPVAAATTEQLCPRVCENCRRHALPAARADLLRTVLEETDHVGMNCLHHAAEAGCYDVLREVIATCKWVDATHRCVSERTCRKGCLDDYFKGVLSGTEGNQGHFFEKMNAADKSASTRTPIMYVLRNMSCGQERTDGGNQVLRDKFYALYEALQCRPTSSSGERHRIGWMLPSRIPSPFSNFRRRSSATRCRAFTELLHAARGGLASLELALNELLQASVVDDGSRRTVDLDDALLVEVSKDGERWVSTEGTRNWGRALLLAAAAKRGDVDALYHVLLAIETGTFTLVKESGTSRFTLEKESDNSAMPRPLASIDVVATREDMKEDADDSAEASERGAELPVGPRVEKAVKAINAANVSVFSYAILSRRTEAVELVFDLVVKLFKEQPRVKWQILSGTNNKSSSSLTCAASASMESDCNGRTMFDVVYALLKRQAKGNQLREELSSQRPSICGATKISPLVGAAFSSNWVLFRQVYDSFEELTGGYWLRDMVVQQIPSAPPRRRSVVNMKELHECHDDVPSLITRGAWSIPAVMWRDIVEAFKRAQPDKTSHIGGRKAAKSITGETPLPSWREDFKEYSRRAVKVAAERGAFTALRDLVKEGFPLHDDHIPALLESIGDHQQDIIETVLFAVANASNPFVMGAMVSRTLRRSEVDHPMHHKGLRRLQGIVDEFTNELLEKLPHTVRGMGVALLGGHQPIFYGHGLQQGKRHRLGNLAGFIVVQWMLEPCLLVGDIHEKMYKGPEYVDPLRRALDRGSKGLDLLNSPLVLDYVHVKFTGTLPNWTSRNPFQPTVNEGFYKYDGFDKYDLSEVLSAPAQEPMAKATNGEDDEKDKKVETAAEKAAREAAENERFLTMAFLLRFLQGWDHGGKVVRNIPSLQFPGRLALIADGLHTRGCFGCVSCWRKKEELMIPHLSVLPGLQFSLAGILGKPGTFYNVPVIRFVFEIFSYLVMLVLFCFSVLLKQHDVIPVDEAIFYVFTAGMLWREVLEFRDGTPARRHRTSKHQDGTPPRPLSEPRLSDIGAGSRFNRMVSAFTRYVFYDTWNFLDTSTICCILVAFIFRMIALDQNDEFFLFHAQFFYALSAPLLFSRLLVLSQIDATLGPMTQVIWRMMSHTLRFSAFIAMVMLSFALAFHAVFHTCDPISDEFEECALHEAFGSFGDSFVTMFSSALGGPDFDLFDELGGGCRCNLPDGAQTAGIFLMVVYMVTMSVVLLNLLIAVLSTAHDEVYANAEKEFHLARARLIYQSARVIAERRPPPPLNLMKVAFGLVVDVVTEVWRVCLRIAGCVGTGDTYCNMARELLPFSATSKWKQFDGYLQELAFALTLGGTAVVLSTILWASSVPWVAWCLLRSVRPPADERKAGESSAESRGSSFWRCCSRKTTRSNETSTTAGEHAHQHLGYFLRLMSAAKSLAGLLVAVVCATLLCLSYIVGSFILWVLGIGMLLGKLGAELRKWWVEIWKKNQSEQRGVLIPDAMPGQEDGDHWERAWELAKLRNHGVREDRGQAHFHVVPFLKSLTGLDTQHLAKLTKERDERSKFEKELIEVDRKLAGAHIDLEHLSALAQLRAKKRRYAAMGRGDQRHAGLGRTDQNRLNRVFGGSDRRINGVSAVVAPKAAAAPASTPAVTPTATDGSTLISSPLGRFSSGDDVSGGPSLPGRITNGGERHARSVGSATQTHMPASQDDSTVRPAGASEESTDAASGGGRGSVGGSDGFAATGSTEDDIEMLLTQLLVLLEQRKDEKRKRADGTLSK